MGDTPRVSVIIPCYNTARFVGKALDSLFKQTYTDFEAIVVDDGSPDREELEVVLAPFLDRIVYLQQPNRGPSSARNTALRAARGEYVALLDSDDFWHPEYLAKLTRELDQRPDVDVVFPDARFFGDAPEAGMTFMQLNPLRGEITFGRLLAQECFVFVGVVARKKVILDAGLFDEELRRSEDYELWLRLLRRGCRIAYRKEVLAFYRKRAESLTTNVESMFGHQIKVWDKVEKTMDLTAEEIAIVREQRVQTEARCQLYVGRQAFIEGDFDSAITRIRQANATLGSFKLRLVLLLLRIVPETLRSAYRLRDRYLLRRTAKFNVAE